MEAEQLEPSPVHRPFPGPGQAEEDVDDAGAVKLHQGDDAGVGGGVEEEGGEALRGGLQGSLDRGQEVGEVGEEEKGWWRRLTTMVVMMDSGIAEGIITDHFGYGVYDEIVEVCKHDGVIGERQGTLTYQIDSSSRGE